MALRGTQSLVSEGKFSHRSQTDVNCGVVLVTGLVDTQVCTQTSCCTGLFREGSHEVIPIPECAIHHPRINAAVEVVKQVGLRALCFKLATFSQSEAGASVKMEANQLGFDGLDC